MKTYIILFGITGDLSRRMLLPSLESLLSSELISNIFLYGVSRRDLKKEDIFSQDSLLSENFKSIKLDENIQDYKNLLNSIELENNDQILIYLSVPPTSALSYVKKLGEAGFNKKNIKLLLEKPFGINYSSAKNFLCEINQYFSEEQVYKVDHYMAKKNSQFIIPFKIANQSFFEEFFNNKFVEKIEVLGLEQIDIQGRSIFYEQTGALRDFIQGHLMQLLILTLCDAKDKDINHILQQRSECVNELSLLNDDSCTNAQYEGYKEEVNNEKSNVETYAKVVLNSSNPKWLNVPLILITGKALDKKESSIIISFKNKTVSKLKITPYTPFPQNVKFNGVELKNIENNFLDGYKGVLYNAIFGKKDVFTSNVEILKSWQIFDSLLEKWNKSEKIQIYKKGSSFEQIEEEKTTN